MGDIYGGGATTLISMYYLCFLTDVMRISPALAGTAFLVSKIWDAVPDPFMGIITDNTRTRFGRRRPYFLAGVVLVFVSFALMWAPVPVSGQTAKFIFVLGAYLFFSTVYTVVWVPYNSIAAELTSDYNERTRLSTWRMIFSNVSGILAGTLAKDLFVDTLYPDAPQTGFFVMAIAFGLFFALPLLMTFFFCREDPRFMQLPRRELGSVSTFFRHFLAEPFRLAPFRSITLMYLFGFLAQDAVLAMAVYFLTYYLGIPSMMTLLVPVYACMLVAIPAVEAVANRIGKRSTYIGSGLLWIAAFTLIPFLSADSSVVFIYVFGALFGAAAAGIQVMVFSMFSDIPDADELWSGERREGLYSGIFALLRKAGGAIVIFLIGVGIDAAGYLPPAEEVIDGMARMVEQTQTPGFLRALVVMFIGVPVVFIAVAVISCLRYPLTRERHDRLIRVLEGRRSTAGVANATLLEEERALKAELGSGDSP